MLALSPEQLPTLACLFGCDFFSPSLSLLRAAGLSKSTSRAARLDCLLALTRNEERALRLLSREGAREMKRYESAKLQYLSAHPPPPSPCGSLGATASLRASGLAPCALEACMAGREVWKPLFFKAREGGTAWRALGEVVHAIHEERGEAQPSFALRECSDQRAEIDLRSAVITQLASLPPDACLVAPALGLDPLLLVEARAVWGARVGQDEFALLVAVLADLSRREEAHDSTSIPSKRAAAKSRSPKTTQKMTLSSTDVALLLDMARAAAEQETAAAEQETAVPPRPHLLSLLSCVASSLVAVTALWAARAVRSPCVLPSLRFSHVLSLRSLTTLDGFFVHERPDGYFAPDRPTEWSHLLERIVARAP